MFENHPKSLIWPKKFSLALSLLRAFLAMPALWKGGFLSDFQPLWIGPYISSCPTCCCPRFLSGPSWSSEALLRGFNAHKSLPWSQSASNHSYCQWCFSFQDKIPTKVPLQSSFGKPNFIVFENQSMKSYFAVVVLWRENSNSTLRKFLRFW